MRFVAAGMYLWAALTTFAWVGEIHTICRIQSPLHDKLLVSLLWPITVPALFQVYWQEGAPAFKQCAVRPSVHAPDKVWV